MLSQLLLFIIFVFFIYLAITFVSGSTGGVWPPTPHLWTDDLPFDTTSA